MSLLLLSTLIAAFVYIYFYNCHFHTIKLYELQGNFQNDFEGLQTNQKRS